MSLDLLGSTEYLQKYISYFVSNRFMSGTRFRPGGCSPSGVNFSNQTSDIFRMSIIKQKDIGCLITKIYQSFLTKIDTVLFFFNTKFKTIGIYCKMTLCWYE